MRLVDLFCTVVLWCSYIAAGLGAGEEVCVYSHRSVLRSNETVRWTGGGLLCSHSVVLDVAGGNTSTLADASYHVTGGDKVEDQPPLSVPPVFRVSAAHVHNVTFEFSNITVNTQAMFGGSVLLGELCLVSLSPTRSVTNVTIALRDIVVVMMQSTAASPERVLRGLVCINEFESVSNVIILIARCMFKTLTMPLVLLGYEAAVCRIEAVAVLIDNVVVEASHPSLRSLRGLFLRVQVSFLRDLILSVRHAKCVNIICAQSCGVIGDDASVFHVDASDLSEFSAVMTNLIVNIEAHIVSASMLDVNGAVSANVSIHATEGDVTLLSMTGGGLVSIMPTSLTKSSIVLRSFVASMATLGEADGSLRTSAQTLFIVSAGVKRRRDVNVTLRDMVVTHGVFCASTSYCLLSASWSSCVVLASNTELETVGMSNSNMHLTNITLHSDAANILLSDLLVPGFLVAAVSIGLVIVSPSSSAIEVSVSYCRLVADVDVAVQYNASSLLRFGATAVTSVAAVVLTNRVLHSKLLVAATQVTVKGLVFNGLPFEDAEVIPCASAFRNFGLNVTSVILFSAASPAAVCTTATSQDQVQTIGVHIAVVDCMLLSVLANIERRLSTYESLVALALGSSVLNCSIQLVSSGSARVEVPITVVACRGCQIRFSSLSLMSSANVSSLLFLGGSGLVLETINVSAEDTHFAGGVPTGTAVASRSALFGATSEALAVRTAHVSVSLLRSSFSPASGFAGIAYQWNRSSAFVAVNSTWNTQPLVCQTATLFLLSAAAQGILYDSCTAASSLRSEQRAAQVFLTVAEPISVATTATVAAGSSMASLTSVQLAAHPDVEEPIGERWVDNPLRLAIGSHMPLTAGTVVGAPIAVVCGAVVMSVTKHVARWILRRALGSRLGPPMVSLRSASRDVAEGGLVLFGALLQPTVAACVSLLYAFDRKNTPGYSLAVVIGTLGFLLVCTGPCACAAYGVLCSFPFGHHTVKRRRLTTRAPFASMCAERLRSACWQLYRAYADPAAVWRLRSEALKGNSATVRWLSVCLMPSMIEPYRGGRHWHCLIDLGYTLAQGIVVGATGAIALSDKVCSTSVDVGVWVMFAASSAYVIDVLVLWPLSTAVANVNAALLNAVATCSLLLVALHQDKPAEVLAAVLAAIATLSSVVALLMFFAMDVSSSRRHEDHQFSQSLSKKILPSRFQRTQCAVDAQLVLLIKMICCCADTCEGDPKRDRKKR